MATKNERGSAAPETKAESVYTARELADNCHVFGATKDLVLVALRGAGKPVATFEDAKKIIEEFMHKEV